VAPNRPARDPEEDALATRIDLRHLVESDYVQAIPQEHLAPDEDLVRVVRMPFVDHILDGADVATVHRDDAKPLCIGQTSPERQDVLPVALLIALRARETPPLSRYGPKVSDRSSAGPVPPISGLMAPANRLQALLDLSHKLSSSLDLTEVLKAFADSAAELTGATAAELSFWERDRDCLVMLVEHLRGSHEITEEGGQIYRLSDFPATRHVLIAQEPLQIRVSNADDDPAERKLLEGREQCTLLMLPLVARGETIGLMEVIDTQDREFDSYDVDFCQALCDVVAIAVRNAMLYAEMQELAARDKLTGLYNRRLFEEQFDAAVARSMRNGEELALLVVDIDGLKRINDLGGHPAGDEALRALADSLRVTVRAGDIPCRLGGDEFAVILPGATTAAAIKVAERAQEALVARGPYSFSGGVARASANVGSIYDLYRSADIAAYRAKAAGGARTLLGVESRSAG
jgi:diguanylate cyclase (GGDEF)-like protein